MVPATLNDFFVASTGASAALIGLLFVAVSIAPERIFGPAASSDRISGAGNAFFVLGNSLFISLGGLLPHLNIGDIILIVGISGLTNTILLIADIWQRGFHQLARGLLLTAGSLAIYVLELWWGSQLLRHPDDIAALDNVTYVLLGGYAVGLARAWELVGGRDYSLIRTVLQRGRISVPEVRDEQGDTDQAASPLRDSSDAP